MEDDMRAQIRRRAEDVAIVVAGLLGLFLFAVAAQADTDVDLRAGYYTDMEAFAVGGGLLTPVSNRWFFNPNVEVAIEDEASMWSINGDFHYDFVESGNASFWLGAGPALLIADPDGGDSDTDFAVNAFAGIGALRGGVRPFGQLKGVLGDNSELVLEGGVRF